jgi:serine protease Do
MDFEAMSPKFKTSPGQYFAFGDNRPRLGLSVQDAEDGKGVKVIDVDEEGNAKKAGVKEDDVIVSINDKEVNSADEVAKIVRENREKPSVMLKVKRDGKTQNIEVRMPRKLKTADL